MNPFITALAWIFLLLSIIRLVGILVSILTDPKTQMLITVKAIDAYTPVRNAIFVATVTTCWLVFGE